MPTDPPFAAGCGMRALSPSPWGVDAEAGFVTAGAISRTGSNRAGSQVTRLIAGAEAPASVAVQA